MSNLNTFASIDNIFTKSRRRTRDGLRDYAAHAVTGVRAFLTPLSYFNSEGSDNFNSKGSHTMVLLGLCDARYQFTVVDIGGRGGDGGLLRRSALGVMLENNPILRSSGRWRCRTELSPKRRLWDST